MRGPSRLESTPKVATADCKSIQNVDYWTTTGRRTDISQGETRCLLACVLAEQGVLYVSFSHRIAYLQLVPV